MSEPSRSTDDPTVAELADQAAHAIRLLNHHTRTCGGGLSQPPDAAALIGALAALLAMLPQLLHQLADWLATEHDAGRLRVDPDAPLLDPKQTVEASSTALWHAADLTRRAVQALDTAHQYTAHLARRDSPDRV